MLTTRTRLGLLAVLGTLAVAVAGIAFEYTAAYRFQRDHAMAMLKSFAHHDIPAMLEQAEDVSAERLLRHAAEHFVAVPGLSVVAAVLDDEGTVLASSGLSGEAASVFLEGQDTRIGGSDVEVDGLILFRGWQGEGLQVVLGLSKASVWSPLGQRLTYLVAVVAGGLAVYYVLLFYYFRAQVQAPLTRFLEGRLNATVRGLLTGASPPPANAAEDEPLNLLPSGVSENVRRHLALLQISAQHKANLDRFLTVSISESDKRHLAENLFRILGQELPLRAMAVLEVNHSLNRLEPIFDSGGDDYPDDFLAAPETCFVYRSGTPLVQTATDHLACCKLPEGDEAFVCVPLVAGGTEMGVCRLVVSRAELERWAPGVETPQERLTLVRSLLRPYVSLAALSLSNLSLLDSYKNQAVTDALTKLYNRRYIMEYLMNITNLAKRGSKDLAVFVIDIDNFKRLNDEYGHTTGDQVLKVVARAMRDAVRDSDIVARYGGEEFVVALPDTDLDTAVVVAERLREAVAGVQWDQEGLDGIPRVTVSVGVAAFPIHGYSHYHLINAADKGVYAAKRQGKNRVVIHRSLPDDDEGGTPVRDAGGDERRHQPAPSR